MSWRSKILRVHAKDGDGFINTTMMTKAKLRGRKKIMRLKPMSELGMNKRLKVFKKSGKKGDGTVQSRISGGYGSFRNRNNDA